MNALEVKGAWNIAKGRLKQKFARLADDHTRFAEGKEDELIGLIQQRTGRNREEVKRMVKKVVADFRSQ